MASYAYWGLAWPCLEHHRLITEGCALVPKPRGSSLPDAVHDQPEEPEYISLAQLQTEAGLFPTGSQDLQQFDAGTTWNVWSTFECHGDSTTVTETSPYGRGPRARGGTKSPGARRRDSILQLLLHLHPRREYWTRGRNLSGQIPSEQQAMQWIASTPPELGGRGATSYGHLNTPTGTMTSKPNLPLAAPTRSP